MSIFKLGGTIYHPTHSLPLLKRMEGSARHIAPVVIETFLQRNRTGSGPMEQRAGESLPPRWRQSCSRLEERYEAMARFDGTVDESLYEEAGYEKKTEIYRAVFKTNPEAWNSHIRNNHNLILDAANRLQNRKVIAILGAGPAIDLPLNGLVQVFERVILIDIDIQALEEARSSLPSEFQKRVELRRRDVFGASFQYLSEVKKILKAGGHSRNIIQKVIKMTKEFRVTGPVRLLGPGEKVDLLVSDMMVTQLVAVLTAYVGQKLLPKYIEQGQEVGMTLIADMKQAQWSFFVRAYEDHLHSLGDYSDLVVVTADMVNRKFWQTKQGMVPLGPAETVQLGTRRLAHLMTSHYRILEERNWGWRFLMPGGMGEQISQVQGLIVEPLKSLPAPVSNVVSS